MSRLTKKVENNYTLKEPEFIYEITNKLGRYEDIEEELGVELITLFKIMNVKRLRAILIEWLALWKECNIHSNND